MTDIQQKVTADVEIPISTHGSHKLADGELPKFIEIFNSRPPETAIPVYLNIVSDEEIDSFATLTKNVDKIVGFIVEMDELTNGNLIVRIEFTEQSSLPLKTILENEEQNIKLIPFISGNLVNSEIKDFLLYALAINT